MVASELRTPRVAIIGAGMSGIGMAVQLQRAGIDDFHLYEQWSDFGGTWHANTYPGLSCDVPSRYYQYTFAPNPDWTHFFSPGEEIQAYLHGVADDHGLRAKTSFSTRVADATWTDEGRWRLETADGQAGDYDFIISAVGGLVHTRKPDIPGLASFGGASFHSAEWDHSVPLDGRRIAVIGTGSTGMQITRALAPRAGRFQLYQRTPQWVFPLANRRYTKFTKWLYRRFPNLNALGYKLSKKTFEQAFATATVEDGFWRKAVAFGCKRNLRSVSDPELRRRFTPDYVPMCKRLVMGTGFYKQFERPNVDLVDQGIDHVCEDGIVTSDGVLHELDVIVLATGFDAHAFVRPMELTGPDGLKLSAVWESEPFAYRSVGLPGFPNVLMLIGPHSPFGNQSLFAISENQQRFAMDVIEGWRRGEHDGISPTLEATERFNAEMREAMPNTVWATGCDSWYIGKDGLPSAWPWLPARHEEILRRREADHWEPVETG